MNPSKSPPKRPRPLHTRISPTQRSKGHSACGAVAYITGQKLTDHRTGIVHDYRKKYGVLQVIVIGYDGTPEQLANAAEAAERKCNAIVGESLETELPYELSSEGQQRLARKTGIYLHHVLGTPVVIGVHAPPKGGDPRNPHFHPWFPTREVDANGKFGKKIRRLALKGESSKIIRAYREFYARTANELLREEGFAESANYDPRKYREIGIDLVPMYHEGKTVTASRRRGKLTERAQQNEEIRHANRAIETAAIELQRVQAEYNDLCLAIGSFPEGVRRSVADGVGERKQKADQRERAVERRKREIDAAESALCLAEQQLALARAELNRREREALGYERQHSIAAPTPAQPAQQAVTDADEVDLSIIDTLPTLESTRAKAAEAQASGRQTTR